MRLNIGAEEAAWILERVKGAAGEYVEALISRDMIFFVLDGATRIDFRARTSAEHAASELPSLKLKRQEVIDMLQHAVEQVVPIELWLHQLELSIAGASGFISGD